MGMKGSRLQQQRAAKYTTSEINIFV